MVRPVLLALAFAALLSCASARTRPAEMSVIGVTFTRPETCHVRVASRDYDLFGDEALLRSALTAEASRHGEAQIEADTDVPYRCLGGAIFLAQAAGFKRVGFVAEPPPPNRH